MKVGNVEFCKTIIDSPKPSLPQRKRMKLQLFQVAEEKLKREHFTIIINNAFYSSAETVEKNTDKAEASNGENVEDKEEELMPPEQKRGKNSGEDKQGKKFISDGYEKLAENNIGSKLLKLMGWSGSGGLGKNQQGIAEPVPITGRIGTKRIGLGKKSNAPFSSISAGGEGDQKMGLNVERQEGLSGESFKRWARELLIEYINSKNLLWFEDLIFSTSFSKEDRATIHNLCTTLSVARNNILAKSYGKDDARHLVVSRKLTKNGMAILYDLIQCGDNPKFSLIIPESFLEFCGE